jgi:hypothetical protein
VLPIRNLRVVILTPSAPEWPVPKEEKMQTSQFKSAKWQLALLFGVLLCPVLPAAAAQVTWYVEGHFKATDASTPADLAALLPGGAAFHASFSFDSAIASHPVYFTSESTDFISNAPLAMATLDVNGLHFASLNGTRILEDATDNGEQLTLNGGAVSGPVPSAYSYGALNVLNIGHFGPPDADQSIKWPWFSPFGISGTMVMISSAAPPDLGKSDNPASLDMFFGDATGGSFHRPGVIEAIQTTPFVSSVPEPDTVLMMLGGLGLIGVMTRRRKYRA